MVHVTDKRIKKFNRIEKIITKFEDTNLPIRKFCKKERISVSKFYYWKKRFDQEGKKGLIDKREGKPYKVTNEIKQEFIKIKKKKISSSATEISKQVEAKFNVKISNSQIQKILRELGLNDKVGRKKGRKLKKTTIRNIFAGVAFVFSALNHIGGTKVISDVTLKKLSENTADGMRICKHKKSVILQYIKTLIFLPLFDMERPIELDTYKGNTLGVITTLSAKHLGYRTTDRFLRELSSLEVGDEISLKLANRYYKRFYGIENAPLYIDGCFKAVWTLKNIPKGKHGMMDKVMPGTEQVFLNGPNGHPLLHRTRPGDTHLTKEILPLINDFETAVGEKTAHFVIFDGEGCSLDLFKQFDTLNKNRERKLYPITVLDSNQYSISDFKVRVGDKLRPLRNDDYEILKQDKKGKIKSEVALVEFNYLSNQNRRSKKKEYYYVRCALVKRINGLYTPIITTSPHEDIKSGIELANTYYNRWPCQEAKFREMKKYCNLHVNYGFKKNPVYNRMAKKRVDEAKKSINYNEKLLTNGQKKLDALNTQMNKLVLQNENKSKESAKKLDDALNKLKNNNDHDDKQKKHVNTNISELRISDETFHQKVGELKEKERMLNEKKKNYLESIEKSKTKLKLWTEKLENTEFYEIDTNMDHIMTNFKILYENSLLFVKDTVFEGKIGFETLLRQVIHHYGDLEIYPTKKLLKFKLNKFDGAEITKHVQNACKLINHLGIVTDDGFNIKITLK